MDESGFRSFLQSRGMNEKQIDESIKIAARLDTFLQEPGRAATEDTAWAFSQRLIEERNNTEDNYIALIRYCFYIKNNEMFVALLELVDGGEVGENLYRRVGEQFGNDIQEAVFAGVGVPPYGIPTPEKPAYLHPAIQRLERARNYWVATR